MEELLEHIQKVCMLPLVMDSPTPGRGNCFFAAVCQQLQRPELLCRNNCYNATTLRKAVCNFALAKESEDVKRLALSHNDSAVTSLRAPWDTFFTNMKRTGVFAEGPVLFCNFSNLTTYLPYILFFIVS